MTEKRRIVLDEADLADVPLAPAVSSPTPAPHAGPLPQVTRGPRTDVGALRPVGAAAPKGAGTTVHDPRVAVLLAAIAGMVLAWMATEATGVAGGGGDSKAALNASSGLWTGVVGLLFLTTVVVFDRLTGGDVAGARKRAAIAAPLGFAAGFVSGFVAQAIYSELIEAILRSDVVFELSPHDARFYFARIIGWGVFGAGVGLALGAGEGSRRRAVNGLLGGLAGGAAGGLVFHFTAVVFDDEGLARFVGLLSVGLLIALAIRIVETVRRESWLRVVAGGMTGKEFILYHPVTRIGASPDCELFLRKDPQIAALHARITDDGHHRVLAAQDGAPVLVNGIPSAGQVLRDGDQLQLGATVLSYSERAVAPAA